ncbi:MAG: hypothetical protein VW405_02310 [Rhodospirillaceae bacterium]
MSDALLAMCSCGNAKVRRIHEHALDCHSRQVARLRDHEEEPWTSPVDAARWAMRRLSPGERRIVLREFWTDLD